MGKTVFTNGCFDILHPGHIDLLTRAKALGSRLVVGINSDDSVRAIKGPDRPIMSQEDRKKILEALGIVDEVIIFDERTPEKLIHSVKPNVLVKGGDWSENEIIGADFVKSNGGEVYSLPLLDGYSSSKVFEKAFGNGMKRRDRGSEGLEGAIREHISVMTGLLEQGSDEISKASDLLISTFVSGSKVLICGNGGSAADAQHLAAEFVGRYELERRSLPAIALTTDTSALTAISNDYGYDNVFERQLRGLAKSGDCLVAISGNDCTLARLHCDRNDRKEWEKARVAMRRKHIGAV
jgi:rfaE bifunctional protein nucleotidyltransferase chain/domain